MDGIIVKKSLHSGSVIRTLWRLAVLSGAFFMFMIFAIGLLPALVAFDIGMIIACGVGSIWLGKFFWRNAMGIVKGKEIAVVSAKGIILKERGVEVIPWENIRKIGVYTEKYTGWRGMFCVFDFFGASSSVGFQFKEETEFYEWAYFSAHFTNYTNWGIVEIMEKFQENHRSF